MKKWMLILAIASGLFAGIALADEKNVLLGWLPHSPTRLEWVATKAQCLYGKKTSLSQYSVDFIELPQEDAIMILVSYWPKADMKMVNSSGDLAKIAVNKIAKENGWDWLNVKIKYKNLELDEK